MVYINTVTNQFYFGREAPPGNDWRLVTIEEYNVLTKEYGIGRIANTPEEWLAHLEELKSQKVRNIERQNNYKLLKEFHTMEKRGPEWDKVFKEILSL